MPVASAKSDTNPAEKSRISRSLGRRRISFWGFGKEYRTPVRLQIEPWTTPARRLVAAGKECPHDGLWRTVNPDAGVRPRSPESLRWNDDRQ